MECNAISKFYGICYLFSMKNTKKIFAIFGIFLCALLCTLLGVGNYFVDYSLSPVMPQNSVDSDSYVERPTKPLSPDLTEKQLRAQKRYDMQMSESFPWLKMVSETVEIKSFDGITLKGRFARNENPSHNYLIMMHGYHDSTRKVSPYARHVYELGFNVLVPGQRGHGWSDGNFTDMGFYAKRDVASWIDFINAQDKNARIMIYGVSMGAATIMMATGLDLPPNVVCAVEDCGYTSAYDQFSYRLKVEFHLPEVPLVNFASFVSKVRRGFFFEEASPLKSVGRSKIPTLFIHGSADDYVPYSMHDILYNAASCPKEKLIIDDAVHARAAFTEPEKYWLAVDSFILKHF